MADLTQYIYEYNADPGAVAGELAHIADIPAGIGESEYHATFMGQFLFIKEKKYAASPGKENP